MELFWGVESLQGKKNRPNEDRYRLLHADIRLVAKAERGTLFAVFDGIGSAPRGGEAAQKMCDALIQFFREEALCKPDVVSIKELLSAANTEINGWGHMPGTTRPLGGCAGTIAWFYETQAFLFHAGDTIGYRLRGDNLSTLTSEQSNDNTLYNYFGIGRSLLIESFSLELEEGDVVILVSDGVTKSLTPTDIDQCVIQYLVGSPQRAATELCKFAQRKGSRDDITALIIEIIEL